MKLIEFETHISAPPEKVWETLWNKEKYEKWATALTQGARFEGNWETGSIIKLFDAKNNGMYNEILSITPNKELKMKHLGWIYDGELSPENWENSTETYTLVENENGTLLKTEVHSLDDFADFFNGNFPKMLESIKKVAEE